MTQEFFSDIEWSLIMKRCIIGVIVGVILFNVILHVLGV